MDLSLENWKQKVSYQSGLLALSCTLAALLLVGMKYVTQPIIEVRIQEDQNALLEEILNGQPFSNQVFAEGQAFSIEGNEYHYFIVRDSKGNIISYVIKGEQEGYSGKIQFLVGVNLAQQISGVRIISHTETPGLGDKIERAKSDWVLSFNGRSLSNTQGWKVTKDGGEFDQFSGATITPRAVVKGVHNALKGLRLEIDNE
ncbi:RnfABCDGE type electron transport complex subunit G [Vibrio hangzhouensis]|uniref:Ion-translocating oxidoreductase complex subunit G n=1 Tax=Vibrio hangzhouensis TaxID=462991 RepID=A0A1H5TFB0_9VIBR|nr:RnfABCDGE type electron transport complex subunit G [Vibrio hangzhouensis]SEF61479.1 electron transport complex protein RnfG [Vibrio hangzhouensis]